MRARDKGSGVEHQARNEIRLLYTREERACVSRGEKGRERKGDRIDADKDDLSQVLAGALETNTVAVFLLRINV